MICHMYHHDPKQIEQIDFGDLLTFPQVKPADQSFGI